MEMQSNFKKPSAYFPKQLLAKAEPLKAQNLNSKDPKVITPQVEMSDETKMKIIKKYTSKVKAILTYPADNVELDEDYSQTSMLASSMSIYSIMKERNAQDDKNHLVGGNYLADIILIALKNEKKCAVQPTEMLKSQSYVRFKVAKMIHTIGQRTFLKNGTPKKLFPETIHLAIYIADKYLENKKLDTRDPSYSTNILATTSMFMAVKMEQPFGLNDGFDVTIKDLIPSAAKYNDKFRDRVISLEANLLLILKFKLFFTTAVFFIKGCEILLDFKGNEKWKSFCIKLAQEVLMKSLLDYDMIFLAPSRKAEAALLCAIGYKDNIVEKYEIYKQNRVWLNMVDDCFQKFKSVLISKPPKRSPIHLRSSTIQKIPPQSPAPQNQHPNSNISASSANLCRKKITLKRKFSEKNENKYKKPNLALVGA